MVSEHNISLSSMHVDMPPEPAWEEVEDSPRTKEVTQEAWDPRSCVLVETRGTFA